MSEENNPTKEIEIIIRNEKDATKWLGRALHDDLLPRKPLKIIFQGWPKFDLSIQGENYNASMPTGIMFPLLEFQKEIRRIYCLAKYETDDLRKLNKRNRKKTEIVIKVEKGSTNISVESFCNFYSTLCHFTRYESTRETHLLNRLWNPFHWSNMLEMVLG